jgi:DNA-binding NarL/FixJ family response regulator
MAIMAGDRPDLRVLVASDSVLLGDGVQLLLDSTDDVKVVGRAAEPSDLMQAVAESAPDALVLCFRSSTATALSAVAGARALRQQYPDLGIVVVADQGNGFALELLRGGASRIAYLLDDRLTGIQAVVSALLDVRAGQVVLDPSVVDALVHRRDSVAIDDLTPREMDVLEQVALGLSNRSIAEELHLSVKAIEKYVTSIFRKLGLTDPARIDRRVSAALVFTRARAHHGA